MYVIEKTRTDGTVQYVASFKTSTNGTDVKYHSDPKHAIVFHDMMTAKALIRHAGAAFASTVKIVDFTSCFNGIESNVVFAGKRFDELNIGDITRWAGIEWKVVKKDLKSAKVYLMTRFCLGSVRYAKPTYNAKEHCVDTTGTDFRRSNLFTLCKYMHKSLESEPDFDNLVTTQSGFKVGVMTKEMLVNIPAIHRSADLHYWTSSTSSSMYVWYARGNGYLYSDGYPSDAFGFRPYICVNMGGK